MTVGATERASNGRPFNSWALEMLVIISIVTGIGVLLGCWLSYENRRAAAKTGQARRTWDDIRDVGTGIGAAWYAVWWLICLGIVVWIFFGMY